MNAERPWLCEVCRERYPMVGASLCLFCSMARKARQERPTEAPRAAEPEAVEVTA